MLISLGHMCTHVILLGHMCTHVADRTKRVLGHMCMHVADRTKRARKLMRRRVLVLGKDASVEKEHSYVMGE